MTKKELARQIALTTGLQLQNIMLVLDCETQIITQALAADEPVYFRGFGKFIPMHRKPRTVRNFKTKESFTIAGTRVPKFIPYPNLIASLR